MKRIFGLFAILVWMSAPLQAQSNKDIQAALLTLGYSIGTVDGALGRKSRAGIEAYQRAFGYLATQRLSQGQTQELLELARRAREDTAVVIYSTDPRIAQRNPLTVFDGWEDIYPELTYANGLHYINARSGQVYESDNPFRKEYSEWNNEVRGLRHDRSVKMARASQDPYAQALLVLDERTGRDFDFANDILPALRVILDAAKARPDSRAHRFRAIASFKWHFSNGGTCLQDETAALAAPILREAQELFDGPYANLPARGRIAKFLASCLRDDASLAMMQNRLDMAEEMSPAFAALAARGLAEQAYQTNNLDVAKTAFARMHTLAASDVPEAYSQSGQIGSITSIGNLPIMLELGLEEQVAEASQMIAQDYLTLPADAYFASTAQQGNTIATLQTLFETRQFEPLRDLGLHLSAGRDPWEAMKIGSNALLTGGQGQASGEASRYFATKIAEQDGFEAAARIALDSAEGWIRVGALRQAESLLDKSVIWSGKAGIAEILGARTSELRAQLNLSRAEAAGPGAALAIAASAFLDEACKGPVAGQPNPVAPNIDHAALAFKPDVRRELIRAGIFEQLQSCGDIQMVKWNFTRLYCHLAMRTGNVAAAEAVLTRELGENKGYALEITLFDQCAFGIGDSGQSDALGSFSHAIAARGADSLLYIASHSAQSKPEVIATALANGAASSGESWEINLHKFLAPKSQDERAGDLQEFERKYILVNSGASLTMAEWEDITFVAFQEGIGWLGLGLPNIAEAFFAVDNTINPYDLTGNGEDWARDVLLDARKLKLVTAHSRVALARGDAQRARSILQPLVEFALNGLAAQSGQVLPASIEQYAFRAKEVFELWLSTEARLAKEGPDQVSKSIMVQQGLALSNSHANLSALDERLTSNAPALARAYQEARRTLRRLQNISSEERDPEQLVRITNEVTSLESVIATSLEQGGTGAFGVVVRPDDVKIKLRAMKAGALILSAIGEDVILSWIDGTGASQHKLNAERGMLISDISQLRGSILNSTSETDAFDMQLAGSLYQDLFGWIGRALPKDIWLVLDDDFVGLPFAALKTPDQSWMGARHVLRTAPSLAWAVQDQRPPSVGSKPFLGIAAPEYNVPEAFELSLAALPETEVEVRFLAATYGSDPVADVYLGTDASEARVAALNTTGELRNARVISFATHGLLSGETGQLGQSALALARNTDDDSDGFLSSEEIFGLQLDADLVILAACNTGTPNSGEGVSELGSAFLFAGARQLMVSHWALNSAGTLEIMREFAAANISSENDASESLRVAIERLSQSGGAFSHPKYWAGIFTLG